MKKILNISTIISTGVLNFIKAADKGTPEKNIFIYVDGVEYKAKEEDNEFVNDDYKSFKIFLKKRINNDTIYNDIINSFETKNIIYDEVKCDPIKNQGENIYNLFYFKRIEIDNSKITINNAKIGKKNTIQSLEILKTKLKDIEKDLNEKKLKNFRIATLRKLESIYIFLKNDNIINDDEIIVSYKIDGNETKIYDFITIDDLEKIYEAISQKKQVDIVSKKININYCFNGRYRFNDKEFTEEQLNKLINLYNILSSNLKYISFNSLTEEEVKNYLKNQYGIDGEVIFESDENGKCITLPNKYLLCRVNLSLICKGIEGKTLKYDYLNQLELNDFKIYPKGTKYSELEKDIKDQFKFLEGKKYTLQFDDGDKSVNIKSEEEIKPRNVKISIDDDEANNDLYEAINENIKTVGISIPGNYYSFYLENVKNKDILELLGKIIKIRENKIIDDFNLEFFNSKNEKLEIENNNNDLNKDFYTFEDSIEINVNIKGLKNNKEDKEKDKGKRDDHTDDGGGTEQSNSGDGQGTEQDGTKVKSKGCSGYK